MFKFTLFSTSSSLSADIFNSPECVGKSREYYNNIVGGAELFLNIFIT